MPNPLDALRRVSARSLTLLLSRAEFAALELAQAREQLMRWLLLALACLTAVLLALFGLSATLVLLLWDRLGWITLALLTVAYAAIGVVLFSRLRREVAEAPPLFSETLAELEKDRDALFGESSERKRNAE